MSQQLMLDQAVIDYLVTKPNSTISDVEWHSYNPDQQAFIVFIYDVLDYFDEVLEKKLKWQPEGIKINQGYNNLVIAFNYQQQRYLFRVPKFGQWQLKNYRRAANLISHYEFFPKLIYIDGQCMIEHFVAGVQLNNTYNLKAYLELAKHLNQLHSHLGEGYGLLLVDKQGVNKNIVEHYFNKIKIYWENLQPLFDDQIPAYQTLILLWQQKLESVTANPVLCHGDLWQGNCIYNESTNQLTLIDWDTCGIYHREKDLFFLLDEKIPSACKQAFFEQYKYPVDTQLMAWFRLTNLAAYFSEHYLESLIAAMNHFLITMGSQVRLNALQVSKYLAMKKG